MDLEALHLQVKNKPTTNSNLHTLRQINTEDKICLKVYSRMKQDLESDHRDRNPQVSSSPRKATRKEA